MRTSIATLGGVLAVALAATATPALAQSGGGGGRGPDRAPRAGAAAPDVELHRLTPSGEPAKETVRVSSFRGKRAVVLIFGSYT